MVRSRLSRRTFLSRIFKDLLALRVEGQIALFALLVLLFLLTFVR